MPKFNCSHCKKEIPEKDLPMVLQIWTISGNRKIPVPGRFCSAVCVHRGRDKYDEQLAGAVK